MKEKALLVLICVQIIGCAFPHELESTSDESQIENLKGGNEDPRTVTIVSNTAELPENCEYLETIEIIEIISVDEKRTTSLEDVPLVPLASIAVDTDVDHVVVKPDMFLSDRIGKGKGKAYSCK